MSGSNMNLQESFLNHVRKEGVIVEVILLNGTVFQGQVRGFDNFTLVMQVDGKQQLIFKHAIAQLVAPKFAPRPRAESENAHPEPAEPGPRPAGRRKKDAANPNGKPDNTPPPRFNAIDFSGIKIDLAQAGEKKTT